MATTDTNPNESDTSNPGNNSESTPNDLKTRLLQERPELEVDKFFRALVKLEGSDLHM